jgi:LmbE family N-acetylglucosaminyl deacetylase
VQKWEAPYDRADMLFISAHSDDEALFFGGVIPTYVDKGYRLQVAYMCEFYRTEPYRRHEQLNGLWTMGIDHYPQLGEFEDLYSESLDGAMAQQDIDEVTEYVVRTVRRFKPQVLISHDFDGEYGHGQHMLLAEATARALKVTADSNEYTDSAGKYGTWDVPKAYFHLYGENEIELDARIPLNSFGGKTCLEVAAEAYKKHESQQWMWFYVSDGYDEEGNPTDYECSCTKYGLYKTAVGNDTGNDLMENIIPYDEQTTPDDRNESTVDATGNEGEITAPGGQVETGSDGQQGTNNNNVPGKMSTVTKILIALGILFVIIVIVMVMLVILAKSKRRRREAVRRRRLAAQRKKRQQQWK